MKKILLGFMSLAFAFSLTACGLFGSKTTTSTTKPVTTGKPVTTAKPTTGGNSDVGTNGEELDFSEVIQAKTEIKVWMDDEAGEYMEELIAAFNEVYPNIVVKHQHMGAVDAREKLKTFGPSGNGADIFQFPHDHLASAIKEDLVYPLSDELKTKLEARIHKSGMEVATLCYNENNKSFACDANSKPRLFAVPNSLESVVLAYNKKLVSEVPASFEELLAEAQAYTTANPGNYYLGTSSHWADSYFIQFAYSAFGFRPFGETGSDSSAVGFDKAALALEWLTQTLKPLVTGNADANSQNAGSKFENGELPYIVCGPWNFEAYIDKGIDLGVSPMPTLNGVAPKTFAGAIMSAVYKYSKNPEAAIKFVEFLSTDEAMNIMYRHKNKLPALKAELLSEEVKADAYLMAVSQQLENSIPMPTIPSVQSYWGPGQSMVEAVWNNGVAIDKAVKDAEEGYRDQEKLNG